MLKTLEFSPKVVSLDPVFPQKAYWFFYSQQEIGGKMCSKSL